jgi:hypothetical protein
MRAAGQVSWLTTGDVTSRAPPLAFPKPCTAQQDRANT